MSAARRKKRSNILGKRGRSLTNRLRSAFCPEKGKAVIGENAIDYEISDKAKGFNFGGIGVIQVLVKKIGLDKLLDQLGILKVHLPYHDADHILNIAYNLLTGGKRLEDIEQRRNDEAFLDALGATTLPDPTTAGDFMRRFRAEDNVRLMDVINEARQRVWSLVPNLFRGWTYIDVDGSYAPTLGECKEGINVSHHGIWGYHPLLITLAKTKEVLFIVNRPGNVVSHHGCATWIDQAIDLLASSAKKICVRGDTDFSLTAHFDAWSERADFIFGMDAQPWAIERAENLSPSAWKRLPRSPRYEVKTRERSRPVNVKDEIIRERGFKNIRLRSEEVAEFNHQPGKCQNSYRVVVVRKNLTVERGEQALFDDIRYFFYITSRRDIPAEEVVALANERCDQENIIAELKGGINALRLPLRDLNSNWTYMIIASLAWNLKSWFGLMMPDRSIGMRVVRMEFRQFLHTMMLLPCQIIRHGRKTIYRILLYHRNLKYFFRAFERIRQLQLE